MATYNRYPAMDENNNFPPVVRQALSKSSELIDAIKNLSTEQALQVFAADESTALAVMLAVNNATKNLNLVTNSDPRLLEYSPVSEELAAVILDSENRETWLGARLSDGGPSDWSMKHLRSRLGVYEDAFDTGYHVAITDSEGRITDLAVRSTDGQVPDFVIERWAKRLSPILGDTVVSGGASSNNSDLVPLFQSIANAAGRYADKEPLPSNPTSLVVNGQDANLHFPKRYSDKTPVPLIIQFEGVGDTSLNQRAQFKEITEELGVIYGKCKFHGNSYGSPNAMADAKALYDAALRIAPISGVILLGNSMGGIGALNALHTGTIPNVLGVYLTDPTYDLRHRWNNGRKPEITSAYGVASDGSDYETKTAGYDPALAPIKAFRGVPISIVASTGDGTVPFNSHTAILQARLSETNDVTVIDTKTAGHNIADRFIASDLGAFITKVSGGRIGLRL